MITENVLSTIRQSGGRLTKVRKGIVSILSSTAQPLSASGVLLALKKGKISANRTTVYRELIFLSNNNIAQKVQLANGVACYEISSCHHHHLICTDCRSIEEVAFGPCLKNYENNILKKEKFKVTNHSLEFYGLCKKCQ